MQLTVGKKLAFFVGVILVAGTIFGFAVWRSQSDVRNDNAWPVGTQQTYVSEELGFSITLPAEVFILDESNNGVRFSVLSPDDPQQQSSIGLLNALQISVEQSMPTEGTITMINGERVIVSTSVGTYGGEERKAYFFLNRGLSARYVVTSSVEVVYEEIIRSIRFEQ